MDAPDIRAPEYIQQILELWRERQEAIQPKLISHPALDYGQKINKELAELSCPTRRL